MVRCVLAGGTVSASKGWDRFSRRIDGWIGVLFMAALFAAAGYWLHLSPFALIAAWWTSGLTHMAAASGGGDGDAVMRGLGAFGVAAVWYLGIPLIVLGLPGAMLHGMREFGAAPKLYSFVLFIFFLIGVALLWYADSLGKL